MVLPKFTTIEKPLSPKTWDSITLITGNPESQKGKNKKKNKLTPKQVKTILAKRSKQ